MARSIPAEEVLSVLIETLVNPLLAKLRPFGGAKAAETSISNQMEAVAWLYNCYLSQELPHLEVLDWEKICVISSLKQTRLSKLMGPSVVSGTRGLTLTEEKIKNACERAASLKSPGNIRGSGMVTKVCVCLLNFRQDKCVLVLGATTIGLWSFIERSRLLKSLKVTSEGVLLSDEELAFQAVEEHTGIKPEFLQLEGFFLINDDLNGCGGSTKFFIMKCSGTFDLSCVVKVERIAWVLIDSVLQKAREPIIDTLDGAVRSTPALQYPLLRPFCSSLENWLTMQKDAKCLLQPPQECKKVPTISWHQHVLLARQQEAGDVWQFKHAVKPESECQMEKPLSKLGGSQVESNNEDKVELLRIKAETSGLNTCIDAPTSGKPQLLTELKVNTDLLISSAGQTRAEHSSFIQKLEEDKQKQTDFKVNSLVMETGVSIGSPQSSTLLANLPELPLRNGGSSNDSAIIACKQGDEKSRQVHQAADEVALSLNMSGPNDRPHSIRTKKKEEEHILDKVGALLSLKTAYRNVRKRRKALSKELSKHAQQMDELYKQIAECDANLATLIAGGKGALQLADEVCKDLEKQMSSSDVSVDHSQAAVHANNSLTCRAETTNKNRTFHMLKSSMQELNEVCTKNAWPMPIYGVFMNKNIYGENVFSGKVRIRSDTFELSESGEASHTSKKAKLSAAAFMLSALHRLKARNDTL